MQVALPDGRELEVLAEGPEDALVAVLHAGTPQGAALTASAVAAAADAGLRLVTTSRPGYGSSTRHPGRSVADVAADTAAVLDHLGTDAFVTLGVSGGGPHALACAALLGDRCRAAATVAGVAPFRAEGLDFTAGMGDENIEEFDLAAKGEAALRPFVAEGAASMREVTGDEVSASLAGLLSPVDVASITGEHAEWLAASFRRAVAAGPDGWLDDDLAFVRPWGFDLAAIDLPVTIWQGDADLMVPPAHGDWLARHVPGSAFRRLPDEGHVSLVARRLGDVMAGLAAATR